MDVDPTTSNAESFILVGAEAYGYGPVSKLTTLVAGLRTYGIRSIFVGDGSALAFAQGNDHIFEDIYHVSRADIPFFDDPRGRTIQCVLSVMDDVLPLWAMNNRVCSVLVDSLFWFWHWDYPHDRLQELEDVVERIRHHALSARSAAESLLALSMHDAQYVAHRLADRVLAQQCNPPVSSIESQARSRVEATKIGAIVDLTQTRRPRPLEHDLVSISGLANTITTADDSMAWARAALRLVREAWDLAGRRRPLRVTGNAVILAALRSEFEAPRFRVEAFRDHAHYRDYLAGTFVLLAPPGLTSIIEAWAYRVPFISLPEQHYGHSTIFRRVAAESPRAFPNAIIDPQAVSTGEFSTETRDVLSELPRLAREAGPSHRWAALRDRVADAFSLDASDRDELVGLQDAVLGPIFGGTDGAARAVAIVRDVVDGSTSRSPKTSIG